MRSGRSLAILLIASLAAPTPAAAPKASPTEKEPQLFRDLVACRQIADAAQRLACLEAGVAAMQQATTRGDLILTDRAGVRAARRALFGLNLPSLPVLGGRDDGDEVASIEGVAASASQGPDGRWVVRLQDGAIWAQTDDHPLGRRPKAGSSVLIKRGAFNSYMMRIDGQPGIKARRQN